MATRINIESDYPDEKEDAGSEGVRSDTTMRDLFIFFTVIFIVVGAILAGIFFGVLVPYTKIDVPPPRNTTTKAPDGDGKTTTVKVTEPTIKPTTTPLSCYPKQTYKWIKDVDIPGSDMRLSLFSGQVTQWKMFSICDRINRPSRSDGDESYGALYFDLKKSPNFEKEVDKIIRANSNEIFGSSSDGLLWTGWAYEFKGKDWMPMNRQVMPDMIANDKDHHNFCGGSNGYIKEIADKKKDRKGDIIYFAKTYWKTNACWELYTGKELTDFTDQPEETIPRLPFVCLTKQSKEFTGEDAMPGKFKPKERHVVKHNDNKAYWLYGVSATLDDAYAECQEHKQQLATFSRSEDMEKFHLHVIEEIRKNLSAYTVKPKSEFDRLWTGGHLNIVFNPSKKIYWTGYPGARSEHSKTDFPNFNITLFDEAFDTLSQRVKKKKNPYCFNQDKLYLGVHFSTSEYKSKLTVLNSATDVDPDTTIVYVLCEEIKK